MLLTLLGFHYHRVLLPVRNSRGKNIHPPPLSSDLHSEMVSPRSYRNGLHSRSRNISRVSYTNLPVLAYTDVVGFEYFWALYQ